jgi:2-polyprenyl-3-methyl-5-hydroxy-6-metoxy-1,4-benzoquinol methylase
MLPLEESPWRELYEVAAAMISSSRPVVDLGAGTGRFAEQLRRRGHGSYTGVDFSPAAIDECRRYVPLFDVDTDWNAEFEVCDLRDWTADADRASGTVFVCLETLEHLADDRDLVRRIPVGHQFVFSVPNHESEAHLRIFKDVGDAWRRYGDLLEFRAWALIGDGATNRIHVYRTVRRLDSW